MDYSLNKQTYVESLHEKLICNKKKSCSLKAPSNYEETNVKNTIIDYSVKAFTWNVHDTNAPSDKLSRLSFMKILELKENAAGGGTMASNIIAIGLQEIKIEAVQQPSSHRNSSPTGWSTFFLNLMYLHDYVLVKKARLFNMILFVFVQSAKLHLISDICSSSTKLKLMGLWGSKGAVSIRFDFAGVNICFVNSHLTAHQNMTESRIADYRLITNLQSFKDRSATGILAHDYVFWLGDLNFRLDCSDYNMVLELIDLKELDCLLKYDQLSNLMKEGRIFNGFREGRIGFAPTYKFGGKSSNVYNAKKKRIPSWTDRILWKTTSTTTTTNDTKNDDNTNDKKNHCPLKRRITNKTLQVKLLTYQCHPSFTQSDHKPVSGTYLITALKESNNNNNNYLKLIVWPKIKGNELLLLSKKVCNNFQIQINRKCLQINDFDWIGICPKICKNLKEDRKSFLYVKECKSKSRKYGKQTHDHAGKEMVGNSPLDWITLNVSFNLFSPEHPEKILLKNGEEYRFIYWSFIYSNIVSISEPFVLTTDKCTGTVSKKSCNNLINVSELSLNYQLSKSCTKLSSKMNYFPGLHSSYKLSSNIQSTSVSSFIRNE